MQTKPKRQTKRAVAFRLTPTELKYYKAYARSLSMTLTGLIRAGLKVAAPEGKAK
jgi:hypothetical protein